MATELELRQHAADARVALHEARGSLTAVRALQKDSSLRPSLAFLTLPGQSEALAKKVVQLEAKHAAVVKGITTYIDSLEADRSKASTAFATIELINQLMTLPGQSTRPPSPSDEIDAFPLPSKDAVQEVLNERRAAAFSARNEARAEVSRCHTIVEQRAELEGQWAEVRGGARALSTLRSSLQRYKLERLERRRQEALGNTIATAQARVAHRHGKRTLAEVAGSRDLLQTLERTQRTRTRPTITLTVALPTKGKFSELAVSAYRGAATHLVEDCLTWMGWPDVVLTYQSHEVHAAERAGKELVVRATISPCR